MINNINDTMLLILSKYVEYSRFVQPACLPKFQSSTFPVNGTNVIAIGWVCILTEKRKKHTEMYFYFDSGSTFL